LVLQNRYTGDMGDFGKFLLLKNLFPNEKVTTIWYLYPDETHNSDGSHTIEESNVTLYQHCQNLDSQLTDLFNTIHQKSERHIEHFETMKVLSAGSYFKESIIGIGQGYRESWLERALDFLKTTHSNVVCLDPDNGILPSSHVSKNKLGKYATLEEIESFFCMDTIDHCVIYQHFNRLKSHTTQQEEAQRRFEEIYKGRARISIIRHNPVQARFYIILSKKNMDIHQLEYIKSLKYADKAFFTLYQ
jgi:hypothetical protein